MGLRAIVATLIALASVARAQESQTPGSDVSVTLAPVVVTATFEMPRPPGTTELAIRALSREMEEKQKRDEEIAKSPLWNARFWGYIPFRLGLSDPKDFFIPNYSTAMYRGLDTEVRRSEKQSLFTR